MQLAPSLHRIGTSSLVNSYIVEEGGRLTVVDTGLPGQWKDFEKELAAMGRTVDDVRAVVLTHGDIDHVGFAERLRRDHGVPAWVHPLDASEARGESKKPPAPRDPMRIGAMTSFMIFAMRKGGFRQHPIKEVMTFEPGATLDVPGSPRVIPMPGHTPGSVVYHFAGVDALFVGDAMTTRSVVTGKVGPALGPFTVDRAKTLESLAALDGLTARWVLPGHGPEWTKGVTEAVRAIRAQG